MEKSSKEDVQRKVLLVKSMEDQECGWNGRLLFAVLVGRTHRLVVARVTNRNRTQMYETLEGRIGREMVYKNQVQIAFTLRKANVLRKSKRPRNSTARLTILASIVMTSPFTFDNSLSIGTISKIRLPEKRNRNVNNRKEKESGSRQFP